jgi:probable HAF family extracellular repeat protein
MNDRGDILAAILDVPGGIIRAVGIWFHDQYGTFVKLNVVPDRVVAFNNRAHVLGYEGYGGRGRYLWRDGELTFLRYPSSDVFPTDLNDRDQIVGGVAPEGLGERAFLWDRGRYTILPTPAGMTSYAQAVNNHGQVLGSVSTSDGSITRPVVWSNGRMTYLDPTGTQSLFPEAINDRGQVIGGWRIADDLWHPFVYSRGRLVDLTPGSPLSGWASAINDSGVIVGSVGGRAVEWKSGRMRYLTPPEYVGGARLINARGDIVGTMRPPTSDTWPQGVKVFRWHGNTATYIDIPANWLVWLTGLDRHGRIGGIADIDAGGTAHPLVWIIR